MDEVRKRKPRPLCKAGNTGSEQEQSLLGNEEFCRSLFENMTEGLVLGEVILDKKGKPYDLRFVEINKAWEETTHISRSEAFNRTYREIVPQPLTDLIEKLGKVAITGESTTFEMYSPYSDAWFNFRAYSPAKGKFASLTTDITERKKAEEGIKESKENIVIWLK